MTQNFTWKGYSWVSRNRIGSPGPNTYSNTNIFVKTDGLHMKITKLGGIWKCADVRTTKRLGYGTYRFVLNAQPAKWDPNMVFGAFNYGGIDYVNEIDIEISQWGDRDYLTPLNYTVYPKVLGPKYVATFPLKPLTNLTTHRIIWTPAGVNFLSQNGERILQDTTGIVASSHTDISPNVSMPWYFDFWLMSGIKPVAGAEIVIHDFEFKPQTI